MALLNVEAKLRETSIDGAPLMSFVKGITHVAVDRVFVLFDPALKARMPRAGEFAAAPGHGAPKKLPTARAPDSWKHVRYSEGNIQLSFSKDAAPIGGVTALVHSADVDIDLGRGLAHAKEWLENNVFRPGHKTNQALVYAQMYGHGILPRYTLDPDPAMTTREVRPALTLKRVSQAGGPRPCDRLERRQRLDGRHRPDEGTGASNAPEVGIVVRANAGSDQFTWVESHACCGIPRLWRARMR